jgi:PAS domain S-box-containing protein
MFSDKESAEFAGVQGHLSRGMMTALLDQSSDCVKILDSAGRIEFMNRNGRAGMEVDELSAIAGKDWSAFWPEQSRAAVGHAVTEAQAGRSSRFEAYCPTAKGTPKWWDVTVSPVSGDSGEVSAIVSISRDVTPARRHAESLETMAQEMRHRLRNAYAIAGAITLASAREEPESKPFAAELARRFTMLSLAQSHLIDGRGGETLAELVTLLVDAFDQGRGLFRLHAIPARRLSEQDSRLVALVIGELCTNSLKHGALRAGQPVKLTGSFEGTTAVLDWHEPLGAGSEADAQGSGSTGGSSTGGSSTGGGSGFALMQRMAQAHGGSFTLALGEDALNARLAVRCG